MKYSRAALLGGVAMMAIAAGAETSTAQAQVQMPGWFGSIAGWWYPWNNNGSNFSYRDSGRDSGNLKVRPDDGFGGRAYAGYRFSNPYDIAFGLQGTWLGSNSKSGVVDGRDTSIKQKAWYWLADAEIGYNGNDGKQFGYRLFAGARYAEFRHKMSGCTDSGGCQPISVNDKFHGIGPRIGMSGAYRFAPGGNWSMFGDISGSYLFGSHRAKVNDGYNGDAGTARGSHNSWNAEGQIGIAYDVAPNVNIAAGYRGEYWSHVGFKEMFEDGTLTINGNLNRLMHGPFVRVAYNIGAPRGPAPVAVPPAPAAVMTKNFIVFFDFDRSNLTGQAQATIREAAAASKTGGVQRVNVTGHADKSGTDQYNMALSLRRANTVKDELVRNGVPANAIVVVARGESQPLVPTADGVREPQNRRVEIVLN